MALHIRRLASLVLFAAAIGCPKPVDAPVAKINDGTGAITGISVGQLVHLDGTGSITASPGGRDLTFEWSFARLPVGSSATLNDAHSQTPSFVADVPSTDATNTYVVRLVVSNAFISSAPQTVTVTVSQCGGRAPVIAALTAAPPAGQTAFGVGSLVSLSAAVTDPDNQTADQVCAASQNQTVSYLWRLVGQPASSTASLNNPTAVAPSFVADVAGDYTLRLVTTDSTGRSSTPFDSKVTVTTCGANAPTVTSVSPVSEQLAVGKTIQMTAIVDDADNDATCKTAGTPSQALTYAWSLPVLPNGSRTQLNSQSAQNASFTPDIDGDYAVRLVVSDSTGRSSAPKDTAIHITKCGNNAPIASIVGVPSGAAPSAGYIGGLLQFGASVLDADFDSIGGNPPACSPTIPAPPAVPVYKLAWALRAVPAGSTAQLNNPTSVQPSFTPDVSGQYKIELVATDSSGLSSVPASATVAVSTCGNNPPSASINGHNGVPVLANGGVVNSGSQITLGATVTDTDILTGAGKCNLTQTFTYAWSLSSRPPGSSAFIVNPTTDPSVAPAAFTADVPNGSYQVQLVVTDSAGLHSVPTFFNVVTNSCGTNAPTITSAVATAGGIPVNTTAPNPGQLVTLTAAGADADNGAACSPALAAPQGLSFQWTLVSRPTSSSTTLTTTAATTATFTPDAIGSYQFSVVVTDSAGLSSAPTYVTVGTSICGSRAPSITTISATPSTVQPLPNPGTASAPRLAASTVTLGAAIADGDDACFGGVQPRSSVWSVVQRPANSSAVLSDPTSPTPAFVPDVAGDYQFQLVVTDSLGLASPPAFVNVHATSCSLLPPAVLALTAPVNPTQLTAVTLPAPTFSANAQLQNCVATPGAYSYRWTMVAEPAGSQAVLDNPASPSPKFTPDKVGAYLVSVVVVNDVGIAADPVFLQVLVNTCGSAPLTWQASAITSTFTDPDAAVTARPEVGAQVKLIPHPIDSNAACGASVTSALTYRWTIIAAPAGSRAALTSATEASPTFVPDVQGTYQISAIATDALGNSSSVPGFITIATGACGANVPSVTLNPSDLTGLNAINSYFLKAVSVGTNDADNTTCPARFHNVSFTYAWSITTTPAGGRASLSSTSGSATTFEAFSTGTGYQLHVVATGSNGIGSDPNQAGSFLNIDVNPCGASAPVINSIVTRDTASQVVISRPSVGQSVDVIVNATDADSSCGAGGSVTNYAFTAVSLPGGTAAQAFFSSATGKLTLVPNVAGTYVYSVVATDNTGLQSAPVQVSISTAACGPVLAALRAAGPAVSGNSSVTGAAITFDLPSAPGDSCVASPSFAYAWTVTQRPAGSQATLSTLSGSSTVLTPDVVGAYGLQLIVTDNAGLTSAPATLTMNVATCGALQPQKPVLQASSPNPDAGTLVTLSTQALVDGNAATCGLPVTPYAYRWSLISVPSGSSAQLSSATAAAPVFTADVPNGLYQVALTVTDALGNVSDPAFLAVQSSKCGVNLPQLVVNPTLSVNANTLGTISASATDADNACSANFAVTVPQITWSIVSSPAGSHPALTSTATATSGGPVFTASNGFQADAGPGTYVVQAVAVASNGLKSAPQQTVVTVSGCGASVPSLSRLAATDAANPAGVARPPVGDNVTVTATAVDPDSLGGGVCGAAPLAAAKYLWSVVSAPAGYSQAAPIPAGLTGNSVSLVPNVAGLYTLSAVAVSATGLRSAPLTITIPTGSCFPAVSNTASGGPINASSFTPVAGTAVSLSMGTATSTCVTGGAAPTVAWSFTSRPAGSGAALTGSTSTAPSFTADVPGTYAIQLIVTDNGGFANVFSTTVTAGACTAPRIVNSGAQLLSAANLYTALDPESASTTTIFNGGRVTLALPAVTANLGGAQAGSCGGVAGFQWSMISRPQGSQALLSSTTDATPSFVADNAGGTYQFSVLIKDAQGNASAPFFFSLSTSACGTYAPTFGAGLVTFSASPRSNAAFTATAPALTDGNVTNSCPNRFLAAGAFSYAYSITAQQAGSTVSVTGNGATASVSTNKGGAYTVQVVATNTKNGTTATTAGNATVDSCGAYPPVASSFSLSQAVPNAAGATTVVSDAALAATGATVSVGGVANSGTSYYLGVPVTAGAVVADADYQGATCAAFGLPAQSKNFAWSLVSAPPTSKLALGIANTGTVVFTPDAVGAYTLSLTTTDSANYSSTGTVTFSVGCGNTAPSITSSSAAQTVPGAALPLPLAGQNKVALGYAVGLDNVSADADATAAGACTVNEAQPLSYQWSFTAVPAGSKTALTAASTKTPSFTPDTTGNYVLQLSVSDPQGHSATLSGITYNAACGASAPSVAVVPATTTPDYRGTQTVTVNGSHTLVLTRTSAVGGASATYDGAGATAVAFYPNLPVQLSANIQDADATGVAGCGVIAQTYSYQWSIASQPTGSVAQIANPTEASPSFTPDLPGPYAFQLTVTDQTGRSTVNALNVNTAVLVGSCGQNAPTATAAAAAPMSGTGTVTEPIGRVQLDATGSAAADTAAYVPTGGGAPGGCGLSQPLTLAWSLTGAPTGSAARLDQPALLTPTFVADLPGVYAFDLGVSDGRHTTHAQVSVNAVASYSSTPATTGQVFTATAVDGAGRPIVAWWDNSGATATLAAAKCTAGCTTATPTWTSMGTIDSGLGTLTFAPTDEPRPIAIATSGSTTYVAYFTSTSGAATTGAHGLLACDVAVAVHNGASWVSWTNPPPNGVFNTGFQCTAGGQPPYSNYEYGRWLSLSAGGATPVVAYWSVVGGNSTILQQSTCSTAACTAFSGGTVDGAVRNGKFNSLVVDPSGVINAVDYADDDGSGQKALRFATNASGSFVTTTVEASPTVDAGRFASMAVVPANPPNGAPGARALVMVYRDTTNAVAKFARCTETGTGCTFSTAPSVIADPLSTNYGRGSVIAVDPVSGALRVAYLDIANNKLRVLVSKDGSAAAGFNLVADFPVAANLATTGPLGLSLFFGVGTDLAYSTSATGSLGFISLP